MCAIQVLACPLDWDEDVPGLSADVILGSDVCYDPEAVPSLVRLLGQLLLRGVTHQHPPPVSQSQASALDGAAAACDGGDEAADELSCSTQQEQQEQASPHPVVAYISTTKRQDSTLQLFLDLCDQAGLVVEEVDRDPAAWASRNANSVSAGSEAAAVVFQELPALQDGRDRYVLHRVTRR